MSYVYPIYSIDRFVTRNCDPNDEWDRDDTAASIDILGIRVSTTNGYGSIPVDFEIDPAKTYYLLWADYDTGDSFGRDGNQLEIIDLFETETAAMVAQQELLSTAENKYSTKYTRNSGSKITYYKPWEGYFEYLNALNISPVSTKEYI